MRPFGHAVKTALLAALLLSPLGAHAQFAPPSCATSSADSTCYTAPSAASVCSLPSVPASEMTSCPSGYYGRMPRSGARDACTGTVAWTGAGDTSGCTNCNTPLSASETQMMMRAAYEASERLNLAFVDHVCPGFNCRDGTQVTDPITNAVMGRTFRNHAWIAVDGFSSGQLPTTNRVNYLISKNQIPSNIPPADLLPKDPNGNPITNGGKLYLMAKSGAVNSGITSCSGEGTNGCNISCTQPTAGWQSKFCTTKTVQYWSCSDSYAVNTGYGWQPTSNVTMPFTDTSTHNYANKVWDWPTVFGWNDPSYGTFGGSIYMCNSTINTCSGWTTNASTYTCRQAAGYDCSYTIPNPIIGKPPIFVPATCSTCDIAMGAIWDYRLTQTNDCPMTPRSTRPSNTRVVWLTDVLNTGCPASP